MSIRKWLGPLIVLVTLAAVYVAVVPQPRPAYAVADLTSGKDDGVSIAAGAADYTIAFSSGYRPTSYIVIASTGDLLIWYNAETATGKLCPAGMIKEVKDVKGLTQLIIDRSAADTGVYVEWKQ